MPNQGLVRRVCVAAGHRDGQRATARRATLPPTAVMTIIEGEWALCLAGEAEGHTWMRLDPKVTVIEALQHLARPDGETAAPVSAGEPTGTPPA